jgi:hypothetical protein
MKTFIRMSALLTLFLVLGSSPGIALNTGNDVAPQGDLTHFANMTCVQQPSASRNMVKLLCSIPEGAGGGEIVPRSSARSGEEILRDLYRERNEAPFWKN